MRSSVRVLVCVSTLLALFFGISVSVRASSPIPSPRPGDAIDSARQAYEVSDYPKAVQLLQEAAAKDPKNPEIFLLLAKSYNELQQHDQAIASAEKAVSLDPKNSVYHEWLGRAYGDKAEHAGPFSGMSLAKKTRKEFDSAVSLDEKNYSARQALIEFDCSAPGIVGGGEDKAIPHIARLTELDAAEGHYAAGNCRRQKKDFTTADAEFTKSLANHPQSANLIYDIGDYAMKHGQAERLIAVANEGEKIAPKDPRGKFYRAVSLILKKENGEQAEALLRDYLKTAPVRNGYPRPHEAHEWLGRNYENENKPAAAITEYEAGLKLDPKSRTASDALKRLKKS
ncbi:MAG: tetratricopeptide repeat protein [Acidobacteria bacterium]|nr:tetratricopeptide repeat protein [Acidobacteriota bacterium]